VACLIPDSVSDASSGHERPPPEVIMIARASVAAALVAACLGGTGCGLRRLDSRPEIRGTLVAVHAQVVDIRHKTGGIYRVELTRETRIIQHNRTVDMTLCPGLRATVRLVGRAQYTASSVTVWSGRCR
jgi:hypothetical protein